MSRGAIGAARAPGQAKTTITWRCAVLFCKTKVRPRSYPILRPWCHYLTFCFKITKNPENIGLWHHCEKIQNLLVPLLFWLHFKNRRRYYFKCKCKYVSCVEDVNYCVGENGRGSKILVFMLRISGTVLATTSFHPALSQVPSRQAFRSARSV